MSSRIGPAVLALIVVCSLVVGARSDGPASDSERVQQLSEQLRCPVCDGLAVADSPSSTARAIAADVRSRVGAGETDDEIRGAYVAQYGEWILLEPPGRGFGTLAWLIPVVLAVVAAGAGAWTLQRRNARSPKQPSPSARSIVADALAERPR